MPSLAEALEPADFKELVLKKVAEFLELKKPIKLRKRGAEVIGRVASNMPEAVLAGDFKRYIFTCTGDTNWHIRKILGHHLKTVIKNISKTFFNQQLYEEMLELLHDEDLMVRLEAVEGLIDSMNTKLTSK